MKKNERIFFSVIIQTYNMSGFLFHSIQSVLDQNYKNFEIIVVDNFSTDDTKKVIKNFKNKKIRFFQINNKGVIGKSRNLGIQKAKGNWIAFLDADDLWFKNKLSICKREILKNDIDFISNSEVIYNNDKNTKKIWHYGFKKKNNTYEKFLKYGSVFSTSASIVNKNFLKKKKILFSEKKIFSSFEDFDFFLNMANKGAKFCFLKKILGKHFFYDQSTTVKKKNYDYSLEKVIRSHVKKQNFEKNKDRLLKDILMFQRLKKNIINVINKNNFYFHLTQIILDLILRPIQFSKIIIFLINRQFKYIVRIN